MNWLQKIATITFTLEDSNKISQPKDISGLAYDLLKFVIQKSGKDLTFNDIQSDGLSEGFTGTINWYVKPQEIQETDQQKLMQEWIQEQQIMGYEIQVRGPERSGMNDWNPDTNNPDLMVYRLDVIKNGSEEYTQIPEINISNDNASKVLGLLNIPYNFSGSISLKDLRQRLATTTEAHMGEFTHDPSDEGGLGTGEVRMIDFGLDKDRMGRYLEGLTRIVDFGLQNGFTNIQWG